LTQTFFWQSNLGENFISKVNFQEAPFKNKRGFFEADISEEACAIVSEEKSFKVRRNEYSNNLVPLELKGTVKAPYEVMAIKSSLLILEKCFPAKHMIYSELRTGQVGSMEEVRRLREEVSGKVSIPEILERYPVSKSELLSVRTHDWLLIEKTGLRQNERASHWECLPSSLNSF
jgi:hypothetical protein